MQDIQGKKCDFLVSGTPKTAVVIPIDPRDGTQTGAFAARLHPATDYLLAFFRTADWNGELTPWPYQMDQRNAFAGEAAATLRWVEEALLPYVKERYPSAVPVLAGYSLAGLFSLYGWAAANGVFAGAASCSGSLWYPDFVPWLRRQPLPASGRVYLSVGDAEKRSRHPLMSQVEDVTRALSDELAGRHITTRFELNPGNHFTDPDGRLAKGIRWLLDGGRA